MLGIVFVVCISIGLPLVAFLYTCVKKQYIPFFLGVLAFITSQVLIRIPLLQYLQDHSVSYSIFSAMEPVFFALTIGMSAGVFEELTRYVIMRLFMKQRDWQSGFLFGTGHGGIEAVLFVGISALTMMFSLAANDYNINLFIGGIERFFAMLLHIGLSIIVLQGVVQRKFLYVVLAIFIHGFVDALIGIVPLIMPPNTALISLEFTVAITALAVFKYSLLIKRRGVL